MLILQNSYGSHTHCAGYLKFTAVGAAVHVNIEMLILLLYYCKDSMCLILIDGRGGRWHLRIAELRGHLSSDSKSQRLSWFQAGCKELVKNTVS